MPVDFHIPPPSMGDHIEVSPEDISAGSGPAQEVPHERAAPRGPRSHEEDAALRRDTGAVGMDLSDATNTLVRASTGAPVRASSEDAGTADHHTPDMRTDVADATHPCEPRSQISQEALAESTPD